MIKLTCETQEDTFFVQLHRVMNSKETLIWQTLLPRGGVYIYPGQAMAAAFSVLLGAYPIIDLPDLVKPKPKE